MSRRRTCACVYESRTTPSTSPPLPESRPHNAPRQNLAWQPVTAATPLVIEVRGCRVPRLVESCSIKLFAPPHRQVRDGNAPWLPPRSYRRDHSPLKSGLAPPARCGRRFCRYAGAPDWLRQLSLSARANRKQAAPGHGGGPAAGSGMMAHLLPAGREVRAGDRVWPAARRNLRVPRAKMLSGLFSRVSVKGRCAFDLLQTVRSYFKNK